MAGLARVLWQEDDHLIRLTGLEVLTNSGLDVVAVGDNEGVRRAISAADHPFDVIVLNGLLPDEKGTEVCAELRHAGIGVPILMQSGYSSIDHYRESMRAGITDCLEKPWLPSELVERVKLLLDLPPVIRLQAHAAAFSTGSNLPPLQQTWPNVEFCLWRMCRRYWLGLAGHLRAIGIEAPRIAERRGVPHSQGTVLNMDEVRSWASSLAGDGLRSADRDGSKGLWHCDGRERPAPIRVDGV